MISVPSAKYGMDDHAYVHSLAPKLHFVLGIVLNCSESDSTPVS
jgi:hypothetical protein